VSHPPGHEAWTLHPKTGRVLGRSLLAISSLLGDMMRHDDQEGASFGMVGMNLENCQQFATGLNPTSLFVQKLGELKTPGCLAWLKIECRLVSSASLGSLIHGS